MRFTLISFNTAVALFNLVFGILNMMRDNAFWGVLQIAVSVALILLSLVYVRNQTVLAELKAHAEKEVAEANAKLAMALYAPTQWQHYSTLPPPYNEMFGPKDGMWYMRSESDPRWNGQGNCKWLVTLGMPPEVKEWIRECGEKYGHGNVPEDCEYGFEKY